MSYRVKTNYDRGYVNAMDKVRVFIESNQKVMYCLIRFVIVRKFFGKRAYNGRFYEIEIFLSPPMLY